MNLKYISIIGVIVGLLLLIFTDLTFLGFIALGFSGVLLLLNKVESKTDKYTSPHPIPHITEREILINEFLEEYSLDKKYKFELKGITFTNAYQMIKYHELIEFDQLTMEIEPNNAYDPNAVALFFKKEKVGYVDQDKAKGAKTLVEQGFNICYIHNIREMYNESTQKKMYFVDVTLPYKMKE